MRKSWVSARLSRRSALAGALAAGAAACVPAPARSTAGGACTPPTADRFEGFDRAKLSAALEAFARSPVNFHGLVISRNGAVIAERYRRGGDQPVGDLLAHTQSFGPCDLHDVRSISKSVTSLLWGIADADGVTPPLDTPVLRLYPELAALATGGREAITLRHLLTMTTGLAWDEENYASWSNDEQPLYWTSSAAKWTFDRRLVATPGQRFNYCGGATAIIADLLVRFTRKPLTDFAAERLFQPLGIGAWEWRRDYRGRPLAFAGLRLTPRDMTKLGQLVLDGGRSGDAQIVPAAWIADATRQHIETQDGLAYGYFWWRGSVDTPGGAQPYVAGIGNGGQRLFIVPALNTVVAITAGNYNRADQRKSRDVFGALMAAVV